MPTAATSISWLGALGWLTAIAAASFLVAWVLTSLLGVRRTPYIGALALLTGGLTWGYLAWSDTSLASFATNRWGWGLVGAAVAGACSVVAPNLLVLGITRVVAGACFAGIIPTTLVYVGDVWPAATRQRPISDILTASATGIALATVGSGQVADLVGWRVVPGLTAAVAAGLAVALRRLPEPDRPPVVGNPLLSLRTVLRSRWGRLVLVIVLVEGAVVLGVLTYLAPAVQWLGRSAAMAGLVAATFGAGALACSRLVRVLVPRVPRAGMAAIGGLCLVAGWAVPAVSVSVATVAVAGLAVGASWAFL
ncbi:MAG TPA: MFS transporter, partial [Actinomycetota bacterium]|nr:MFS transporter [Actinomycetota bacterium]